MAKAKDEKEVKRNRGNNTVMKSLRNLTKSQSLWGQFFHRIPAPGAYVPPSKSK